MKHARAAGRSSIPGVVAVALVGSLLLATACHSTGRLPLVPSPETRVVGDIRGVVLKEQAGGGRIEFSRVSEVRWTPSELIITGTVTMGQTIATFPLEDVSHVLLAEPNNLEIPAGLVVGTVLGLLGVGLLILGPVFS